MAHVANNDLNFECDAEDLIPLSRLRSNLPSMAEDMIYVLYMPNILTDFTNVEIRN